MVDMQKVKIKLVTIGHLPLGFQLAKIKKWESSIFEVVDGIENYALRCNSDSQGWEFSDALVKGELPQSSGADFLIAIVNVPIQDNWYSRRLGDNQVVFTFYQIRDILESKNIPLENVIYRLLYAYTLVYKRCNNSIPSLSSKSGLTHDETRGCLFDMNGIKTDLVASCDKPKLCSECQEKLRKERVSNEYINGAQKEIIKIRKELFYRLSDWIKKHPILALLISGFFALLIGVASSIVGSYVYSFLLNSTSR